MRIHMYGMLWNEAPLLPYFFRHYDQFVERYVLFDNGSDDGTLECLAQHSRVETRSFAAENDSVCETAMRLKSHAWKESRGNADLVLVCDVDELLHHPDLRSFLSASVTDGFTLFRPCGWQMVADSFPTSTRHIYDEVRHGFRSTAFNKPCLFDPNQIEEINYEPGCHFAHPTGNVLWREEDNLKLLHFKYLGARYVTSRYAALNARLGTRDREYGWGCEYQHSAAGVGEMFSTFVTQQVSLD